MSISFRDYNPSLDDTWLSGLLNEGEVLQNIVGKGDLEKVMVSSDHGQLQYFQFYEVGPKLLQFGHTYTNPNQTSIRGTALFDWVRSERPLVEALQVTPNLETMANLLKQRYPNIEEVQNGPNVLLRIKL